MCARTASRQRYCSHHHSESWLLDLVFSLDSIVTAVGMTNNLPVMIAAIVVAILVMMFAAGPVSGFIMRHPTVKMLALAFLILVGMALIADAVHFHIPREFIFIPPLRFSIMVEALAIWRRRRAKEQGHKTRRDGGVMATFVLIHGAMHGGFFWRFSLQSRTASINARMIERHSKIG